ncbi:MAG: ATP-binding cassette domain-containing protein [Acidobacteriota bacterium]
MLEIKGIAKAFGTLRVLAGVSMRVEQGERVALRGATGSGKTTFLRLIAGLEEPDAGEIWAGGARLSAPGKLVPPHRRGVAMVFQSPCLWPHMTVAENVGFAITDTNRASRRDVLRRVLETWGVGELAGRYPDQLSTGQARKVAVARAMAKRPRILLMDEALVNLDVQTQEELLPLIDTAASEIGCSMMYVTHAPAEADRLGCRSLWLRNGRLDACP